MRLFIAACIAACCLPLFGGCAHYEYNLVQPPQLAQPIGTQHNVNLTLGPLHYLLIAYDNYLVMRIYNESDAPIRLLGDRSFVVDPKSQSHPFQTQTIAPHAFIKLTFPPLPPMAYASGPAVGFSYGYGWGWRRGEWRGGYYDPFWDFGYYPGPQYVTVYRNGDTDWDWTGDTEVQLTLTYQQAEEKPFSHPFVFRQRTVR